MLKRRDVLKIAVGGLTAVSSVVAEAQPQPAPEAGGNGTAPGPVPAPAADSKPFDFAMVVDAARALAKKPFKAPAAPLPDPFANLGYDQYVAIRNRPEGRIWGGENIGFALEPLHRGFLFSAPMALNVVENGVPRRLVYRAGDYDFGRLAVAPNMPDIGFSGFRVLKPRDDGQSSEVAVFQGASFFRALATGQNLGVMARGLAVRTADTRGEEFPMFREMWIERPTLAANALVIHGLLDSESLTGAYRLTLRPGDATIIDTECTLFPRVAVDHIGLGAMQGTFLLGPVDRRRTDDIRPMVSEFQGLRMLTGRGEWLWRPVSNRETLQVSSFMDDNPAGFGFLQKDRDFDHFQDDDQHWEMRPSLWIEPIGEWGQGSVNLVEIPSESEVNQNVVAYWRPKTALAANSETSLAYRQFWCWSPPNRPPLASVSTTRTGKIGGTSSAQLRRRRFLVEFTSDAFGEAKPPELAPNLTVTPGSIISVRTFISRARKTCRVLFDFDPGSEVLSEMRLVLEADGKPISETWLYRWTS